MTDRAEYPEMPLPLSTTWSVLESLGADVSTDGEHLRVAADLPGHRWSKALSVLAPARVNDAEHWIARAAAEFPTVRYPAIGLPARPDAAAWAAVPCPRFGDVDVEWFPHHWVALTAADVTPAHPLGDGYDVVLISEAHQWEQFARLPSPGGPEYQQTWTALKRRRQEEGRAAFFAGMRGEEVVATGGIVLCSLGDRVVARYEDITTQPGHRRRGIASHILAAAHAWAREHGADLSVLVADAEGDAIGTYQRLGFRAADEAWMVLPRRHVDDVG